MLYIPVGSFSADTSIAKSTVKKHKNQNTVSAASGSDVSLDDNNSRSTAQNVYNYNYLNESNTGNTLFGSKQKTRRTLFGNNVKG